MSARIVLSLTPTPSLTKSPGPVIRTVKGEAPMTLAGTNSAQLIFHLAIAGLLLLLPEAAMAKGKRGKSSGSPESVSACVDNYKTGLDKESSGHLRQARELFIKCSKASCGSPLRAECTTRFTPLSTDIPSTVMTGVPTS